ncbi:nitroreductase [Novosphingobium hassiacum]|uniref:Nitroreductase n=1 Tax=Novosphingobium hassiacum TaxID=173676 RepID=A0A7W6EW70_9SPHN|nr:nitroreductase [Novosphingobium hassiacum]MBB3860926.1 nitroreductase [Novosphingobium hassiacum]
MLKERRSVRGFRPNPVPEETLRTIFSMAQLAPSNCNVQPWLVHVVSGNAAQRLGDQLVERARAGAAPTPDVPLTMAYEGEYRSRQIDAAKALFAATGVARDDTDARFASFLRNYRFFDAPHAAFLFMPGWCGMREAADCGLYAQSLMLAMTAHGVASCAQGALSHYADIVHDQLGVDVNMKLLFGIAFGYEDTTHPANSARTSRLPVESTTHFHC